MLPPWSRLLEQREVNSTGAQFSQFNQCSQPGIKAFLKRACSRKKYFLQYLVAGSSRGSAGGAKWGKGAERRMPSAPPPPRLHRLQTETFTGLTIFQGNIKLSIKSRYQPVSVGMWFGSAASEVSVWNTGLKELLTRPERVSDFEWTASLIHQHICSENTLTSGRFFTNLFWFEIFTCCTFDCWHVCAK